MLKVLKRKSMDFSIDDDKLLEKYRTILTKTEGLKSINLNSLSVIRNDKYRKNIFRWYKYRKKCKNIWCKVYTNFCGVNVPEESAEC